MKTKDLFLSLGPQARILFIRLRSMGDCLLLTSPIRALKEEFPGFRISVLVESRFADCYSGNPDIDHILAIRQKSEAIQLLQQRFDLIVNLHGGPTSLMYGLIARGPCIGFEQFQYRWLYRGLLPKPDATVHSVEATMNAFQWMGVRRPDAPALRYEGRESVSVPATPYAVLHPAAVMETKRWEAARFAQFARALQDLGLAVLLTCGPGEEGVVAEVARDVPNPRLVLAPGIRQLAGLIRGARLYAGNDSGPMHLAAAVGTPIIALWGSSDSRRWRPWHVKHAVVQNPFECNPCPGYRCLVAPTPLCIESVTVEQAVAAARQVLNS